jgi:hypothetical protein
MNSLQTPAGLLNDRPTFNNRPEPLCILTRWFDAEGRGKLYSPAEIFAPGRNQFHWVKQGAVLKNRSAAIFVFSAGRIAKGSANRPHTCLGGELTTPRGGEIARSPTGTRS